MVNRILLLICCVVAACTVMAGQTEPALVAVNLPKYPPLARQARIEGAVRISFTLPANSGTPSDVEVISGHPGLNGAALDNVKTWKFENPYAVARKYQTTFRYKLTGFEVPQPKNCVVTFDGYRQVDVVSDVAAPVVNY